VSVLWSRGGELAVDLLVLAFGDVGGPASADDDLAVPARQAGVSWVLEDFVDPAYVERLGVGGSLDGFGQPAGIVDAGCDLSAVSPSQRESEDQLDQRPAVGVEHHSLGDLAALVDVDRDAVAVGQMSDVLAAGEGAPASGLAGEGFAFGVLVVALAGDDGVEQVAEGVGVLEGADADVVL
jgi:hypothetical protein